VPEDSLIGYVDRGCKSVGEETPKITSELVPLGGKRNKNCGGHPLETNGKRSSSEITFNI